MLTMFRGGWFKLAGAPSSVVVTRAFLCAYVLLGVVSLASAHPLSYKKSELVENRGCVTTITERDRIETEEALNDARSMIWSSPEYLEARSDPVPGGGSVAPVILNVGTATANVTAAAAAAGTLWRGGPLPQVVFDVYWHVLYANETIEGGYVTDKQIMDQMDVMNQDYGSANISWNFVNITRIPSKDWFVNAWPGSPQEADMKRKYHKGNSRALNIFTAGFNDTDKSLGYSSLPSTYLREPLKDGLIIRYTTLPGGSNANYNLGRTTVHETGHWLGLYHTFEGGCSGVGDNVGDTAPESSGAEGCPTGRKSCPDSKELDPIHNFMDYSTDSCMESFTPGQAVRMHEAIWAFRTPRPPVVNTPAPTTSTATSSPSTLATVSSTGLTPGVTTGSSTTVTSAASTPAPTATENGEEEEPKATDERDADGTSVDSEAPFTTTGDEDANSDED